MSKSVKSRAEEQFAATQKKDKQALQEKEKLRQDKADHASSLRVLRLAKEATDKKAEELAEAEEAAAKKAAARKKAAKKTAAKKKAPEKAAPKKAAAKK